MLELKKEGTKLLCFLGRSYLKGGSERAVHLGFVSFPFRDRSKKTKT